MGKIMATAGKFHLKLAELATPEDLFRRLKSIFGDEDLAEKEFRNACYADVRSVRVPWGAFGRLLWEEAELNNYRLTPVGS
jgi:hypothetical protein